jgi:hypothetical protein
MVRILLSSCFLVGFSAFAHDSGRPGQAKDLPPLYCEHKLGALNYAQIEAYRFLKRLQTDTDQEFPAEQHTRVAVGRAIAPLAAAMQQVSTVPLELNFRNFLEGADLENLWKLFKLHLPDLNGKDAVIMLYSETSPPVHMFSKMLLEYFRKNNIAPKKIHIHVFTSQYYFREMRAGLTDNMYTFRPIGHANDVRRWFHEGLKPTPFSYSQFPIVDVHGKAVIEQIPPEREPFVKLKLDLETLDKK